MIIIHKVGWNDCLVMKYDLFKKRFLIQVNYFFYDKKLRIYKNMIYSSLKLNKKFYLLGSKNDTLLFINKFIIFT